MSVQASYLVVLFKSPVSLLIFCLGVYQLLRKGIEISNCNCNLKFSHKACPRTLHCKSSVIVESPKVGMMSQTSFDPSPLYRLFWKKWCWQWDLLYVFSWPQLCIWRLYIGEMPFQWKCPMIYFCFDVYYLENRT